VSLGRLQPKLTRRRRYRRIMTASEGSPFACTGRAVSVRPGDALTGAGSSLGRAARGGAAILIASPGCWPSPEHAIAAAAGYGFQVILSAGLLDNSVHNSLIKAGILFIRLRPETVLRLQETVEADPGIVLTVDFARGDVRAGGESLARFESHVKPGQLATEPADSAGKPGGEGEMMARRLLMAQRLLGSAILPGDARMRLQRRLVAICDAMKSPGADTARGGRRLDRFLADLARSGHSGPPDGASRARCRP
jgi:hypothetical protein